VPPSLAIARAAPAALTALLLLSPARAEPPAAPSWTYEVVVAPGLESMSVRLCFPGARPRRLVRAAGGAFEGLRPSPGEPQAEGFDAEAGSWTIARPEATACVSYDVDLAALSRGRGMARSFSRGVTEAGAWLLRPAATQGGERATLRFRLPPGHRVSAPWAPVPGGDDASRAYELDATTWAFIGHVAIGSDLRQETVPASGAALEVTTLPGPLRATPAGVRRWLEAAASAVASVYGRFPRDRVQVVVRPVPAGSGHGHDPVPFGSSWQGGGAALLLLLSERARDEDLPGEWVAVHEMVHLAMPPISHEDAWLSEGFATYYQEVLRARAGFLEPLEAWRTLDAGFERGREDGGDAPLAEESRRMRQTHEYLRVYWAGAAIALLVDVELRRGSGGASTLDGAMRRLTERHGGAPRFLAADDAIAEVDRYAGRAVFRTVADAALASSDFPPLEEAYRWLGLARERGALVAVPGAPGAAVRDAIVARPSPLPLPTVR
jgi:hypothetical protein